MNNTKKYIFFNLTAKEKNLLQQSADYFNLTVNEYVKKRLFNLYIQDQTLYQIINTLKKINGLLNYSYKKLPAYIHTKETLFEYKEQYENSIVLLISTMKEICNAENKYNISNSDRIIASKKNSLNDLQDIYFDRDKYSCRNSDGRFIKKINNLRNKRNKLSLTTTEYDEFKDLHDKIKIEFADNKITQTELICSKLFLKEEYSIIFDLGLIEKIKNWGYEYKHKIANAKKVSELNLLLTKLHQLLKNEFLENIKLSLQEKKLSFNCYIVHFGYSSTSNSNIDEAKKMRNDMSITKDIKKLTLFNQDEYEYHNDSLQIRL